MDNDCHLFLRMPNADLSAGVVRNRVVTVNRGCGGFAAGRATQRGLSLFGVNDFSLRQRWHARYKDWSGYPTPWHFGKAVKRAR